VRVRASRSSKTTGFEIFAVARHGSGFVQSGFCEVALTPAFEASLCHATSQNPRDFLLPGTTGALG